MIRISTWMLAGVLCAWTSSLCAQHVVGDEPRVRVIFQAEPSGSSCETFVGAVENTLDVEVAPGREGEPITLAIAFVSEFGECTEGFRRPRSADDHGVAGWGLSVSIEGNLEPVDARVRDEVRCVADFSVVEIIDPLRPNADGEPQGMGAVFAEAYFCGGPFVLNPGGTETAHEIDLVATDPDAESIEATLTFRDGLRGSGQPVENYVVLYESRPQPRRPVLPPPLRVRVTRTPPKAFRRCDANDDGRFDISDPIRTLGWLFIGRDGPPCEAAADCDGNRALDLSDAIRGFNWLFQGGPPPPAPFPDCGFSADASESCYATNACAA